VHHEYADNVTIYSCPNSEQTVSFEVFHGLHNMSYFYWQHNGGLGAIIFG